MYKKIFVLIALILMLSFSFASLTTDLTGYWNLDEASGDAIDSFVSNDLTENGTVGTTTGIINDARGAYTSSNYFNNNSLITTFDARGSYSVSFWIKKPTTVVNDYEHIFTLGTSSPNTQLKTYIRNGGVANQMTFALVSGGSGVSYLRVLSTTDWTHYVLTMLNGYLKIYENGTLVYTTAQANANTTTGRFWLGFSDEGLSTGFSGNLDEFGVWEKTLTQSEVTELYNSGSGLAYPFGESVTADFNYVIDYETKIVSLTDNSSVIDALEITDWNWLKDGNVLSTDQNTSFSITPNNDYNICLIVDTDDVFTDSTCKTIEIGGELQLNFYDDDTNTGLDEMYLLFNGVDYYSDSNTFINIDLNGITSGLHSIVLQRTDYQEKSFSLELNEYSDYNYDLGFILSSKISNVQFQVFDELGATQPNTTFMVIDNYNGFIIDFETTDSLGRVTFILNNQKEDYGFFSDDLNFGTTTWTINKPKDAITLAEISGDWKYSITGNSYSSQTNIASGITKLLLQNTVNPYYMSVQDVDESYVETTFGLISVTSKKTKTLTPFLYKLGDAELRLLIVKDYATNQPISRQIQLDLSLYTDSNGLIPIGSFINDSTGTYNIYMDSNSTYRLELEDESFELNPSELINLYHIYLQTNVGIYTPVVSGDVNIPLNDLNFPTTFFTDVSDYAFGCNINDDSNCYAPTVFSLIATVLLLIVFVAFLQTTPIQQTIASGILLTLFTLISFIPIWVFAITLVIIIAWGLFT